MGKTYRLHSLKSDSLHISFLIYLNLTSNNYHKSSNQGSGSCNSQLVTSWVHLICSHTCSGEECPQMHTAVSSAVFWQHALCGSFPVEAEWTRIIPLCCCYTHNNSSGWKTDKMSLLTVKCAAFSLRLMQFISEWGASLQPTMIFKLLFRRSQFKSHVAILAQYLTSGLPSHHMAHRPSRVLFGLAVLVCPSERRQLPQVEIEGGLSVFPRRYKKTVACRPVPTVGRPECTA